MKKRHRSGMKVLFAMMLAVTFGWCLQVQAAVPAPTNVTLEATSVPANGSYFTYNEQVIIVVEFDRNIDVSIGVGGSKPYLSLTVDPKSVEGTHAGFQFATTNALYFSYSVLAGDYAYPLGYPSGPLALVTGDYTISDAATPSDEWNPISAPLPAPGAAGALDTANIQIRTVTLTPAVASIAEGDTLPLSVNRGGTRASVHTVYLVSDDPTVASVPASVTIPFGADRFDFPVTGLATGVVNIIAYPYGIGNPDGSETNVLTVTQGASPTFSITLPRLLYEGPTTDAVTFPYMGVGTVTVSRAAAGPVSITLTSSDTNKLELTGLGVAQFAAGESVATFPITARDGGARVEVTGVDASATYTTNGVRALIPTINMAPVLYNPPLLWEPAPSSEGYLVTFSWGGTDVPADLPTLEARVSFGDGTDSGWILGASGTTNHIYNLAGTFGVTVELRDKDGGIDSRTGQILIAPATEVLITEVVEGDPNLTYLGLPGLGHGTIDDTLAETVRQAVPLATNSWTIKYDPTQPSVVLVATPTSFDLDVAGETNTYDSFFHVWQGDGFTEAERLVPLAYYVARLELAGQDRDISGVFSRELFIEDNYADIDLDGLPDKWEELWWPGQRLFEVANTQGNPDLDFLPAVSDAAMAYPDGGVGDFSPTGIAFGNYFEVRGADTGLNAVASIPFDPIDEPHYEEDERDFFGTDPTVADTDGDGIDDGWEYYFWMNATVNFITGVRYDPLQVITSTDVIFSDEIAEQFHPLIPSGEGDTDGDGISDLEEYALGMNPIMWDSDGDLMADGWEVTRGLNPIVNDGADNPDGDYMAALGYTPETERIPPPQDPPIPLLPLLNNIHFNVYDAREYDPRTGWGAGYTLRSQLEIEPSPNTTAMLNIDEYGLLLFWMREGYLVSATPDTWGDFSTEPLSNDTDGDGAPDGWELYVSYDPCDAEDGNPLYDPDGDGLYLATEFGGQDSSSNKVGGTITLLGDMGGDTNAVATSTNGSASATNAVAASTNATASTNDYTYSEITYAANPNERWWNKFWPTNPNNGDTDGDSLLDGSELADFGAGPFLYDPPVGWDQGYIRGSRAGGGLNPCCVDTDMDFIPDYWEALYRYDRIMLVDSNGAALLQTNKYGVLSNVDGMDGSIFDSKNGQTELTGGEENYDYDSDGLENYQEYYVNAMWHFNYDKWQPEQGPGAYAAGDFFTGRPNHWDWAIAANYWEDPVGEGAPPPYGHVPFIFIQPEPRPFALLYASTDPSSWDSDYDGMDDHYEMFYGLNPLFSETMDLIGKPLQLPARVADIRVQPWTAGEALADPDQDGLPNWEEAIFPSRPAPANHNSDPSPYWVTDPGYAESWVNLYYTPNGHSWFWATPLPGSPTYPYPAVGSLSDFPPSSVYSFESDEGYDTDNDNLSDRREVTGADEAGTSDPAFFDDPRLRKALYLDGASAARTRVGFVHELNQLRSWTVEMWVRSEEPVSPTGERQILIERPLQAGDTDPMPSAELIRRTFRLGLEPSGRPFAEYNNMGNDLLTESISATGYTLQSNQWYHIAATMDGLNSSFTLYVNGVLAQRRPSTLIPATGIIDGRPPLVTSAPIVVGAADENPNGIVQTPIPGVSTPPVLHSQFKGWVDEVRVWDGARSQEEIQLTQMHRFTLDDVTLSMTDYAAAMALIPDVNPIDMDYQVFSNVPPVILYHYAFDNLPDSDHDPIAPQGFELLNGRPSDASWPAIAWWGQAVNRSRVYSDYKFVHWAENTPSHVPAIPVLNRFGSVIDYIWGIEFSSPYWTLNAPPGTFEFKNRTFTSQQTYFTGDSLLTEATSGTAGLLPLWNAEADMDVPMWDNNTPGTSGYDSNGDGIPDWWARRYGFDPYGPSIAASDPDGDGLSNYYEYRMGSNPTSGYSLDPSGALNDAAYDSDGDGLSNIDEIDVFGTDPSIMDTDNDKVNDFDEIHAGTDPLDSLVTLTNRVLTLSGALTDYVRLADEERFALTTWVVEAWVNPSVAADAEIIARQDAQDRYNYRLGLSADGRPVVGFNSALTTNMISYMPAATNLVPVGTWTHLRGGFDAAMNTLYVEINGVRYADELVVPRVPATHGFGPIETRVGRGFNGMLDDVRLWSQAPISGAPSLVTMRPGSSEILKWNYAVPGYALSGREGGLVSYLRFDDGIIAPSTVGYEAWAWNVVQDFAAVAGSQQWDNQWRSSARLVGTAGVIGAPTGTPTDIMFITDDNSDGLPDWWQRRYWPAFVTGDSGDGAWAPTADPDGDGLLNINEYLAYLDPRVLKTEDGMDIADGLRDHDADGLNNLFEQDLSASRVDLLDTDDDGYSDYEEVTGTKLDGTSLGITDPLYSLDPIIPRGLTLDGSSRMVVQSQRRHAMTEWTLAAWIHPDAGSDGTILARTFADSSVNYEVALENDGGVLRPYVRYHSRVEAVTTEHRLANGSAGTIVVNGPNGDYLRVDPETWTHVAATYTPSNSLLSLYIDGTLVAIRTDAVTTPFTGQSAALAGELTIGGGALGTNGVLNGFEGAIDDVRLLSVAGDAAAIQVIMDGAFAKEEEDGGGTNTTTSVVSETSSVVPQVVPGEYLVGVLSLKRLASVRADIKAAGMDVQRTYKSIPVMHVKIPEGDDAVMRLQALSVMDNVRYVEPNYKVMPAAIPNDPDFDQLWGMNNTGAGGGVEDADIDAVEAWDVTTGGNIIVAVIDSGVDHLHPDLAANMWVNPGEIAGNGIDDDGNGYIDDINGYDFGAGDADPMDDIVGHGTHCAGTIGAVGNNGEGVSGVNWNVKLMALKIADDAGGLSLAAAIEAIEYAVQHGARVSNNSWGGYGFSQALYDAIRVAGQRDHLFVAAAANDANDNDQMPAFPASYDLANIIAVAATDRSDALAGFSNYGLTTVDLGAPGVEILSTLPTAGSQMGQTYGELQGTSMAAPHVAGAAAILLSVDSGLSAVAIKAAILDNADPIPALDGRCVTGARLNLANALPAGGGGGAPEVVIRGLVGWFLFDDGGQYVEDFTRVSNGANDWFYSGRLEGTAAMTYLASQVGIADSDGDGLPDWWENAWGLDPHDATGDSGAASDPDGDGLSNLDEYRISLMLFATGERGLNPMQADSDLDGSDDGLMDSDADGLTNLEEVQTHLTNPALPDTDDDGLTDKEEVDRALDPLDSLMPYIMRFVRNDTGTGHIEVPGRVRGKDADGDRFNLDEWTIEATVRLAQLPSVTGDPVVLVSRRCKPYGNLTFELGIGVNDHAYVRFHSEDPSQYEYRLESVAIMETGKWTSVAGRLSHAALADRQQLDIFVNSSHDSRELSNASVALGVQQGPLVIAQGLRGDIDEVRIWNVARSNGEIDRLRRRKLHFGEDVATMGVLNVNGGVLHRSYNQDIRLSTWTAETWFKSDSAGMVMQRAAGTGDDGVNIYNYRINITDQGYIEVEFAFNTLVDVGEPRYRWATVTMNAPSRRVDRGQWHFVSFSYDGRDAILYLDGLIEDRVTIDPLANLPALGLPYWHVLDGEANPPTAYLGQPATMATQEGVFRAGEGMQGQLDEIRVFAIGSTQAEIDLRRFSKVAATATGLMLYYDFDDLDDLTAERVEDKANMEAGIADLLQGASLDSGSGVNAPIEFSPLQILAPKLAAYFPMDEGTYTRLSPPRGFDGRQVKDFLRKLDFDFAGTFSRSDVYFTYNATKYTENYLANIDDWLEDTDFITDADGDGMPDWWEVLYGLDPNRVTTPDDARMGPYGDPDRDGLGNLSEFLASTDPFDRDTMRSGFGDYDSRPSAFEPTFGQRFDDGDRIADEWEVLYMYKTPVSLNRSLDPVYYDALLDPDEDRWSNYAEFMGNTDPTDPLGHPEPLVRVTARYSGYHGDDLSDILAVGNTGSGTNAVVTNAVTGGTQLHLHFYDRPTRDGFSTATVMTETTVTELRTFDSGQLTEGMNYIFAFLDMNGDGEWDPVNEPAGISSFNMGWGDWNEVEIPLTDDRQMRGFPRFSWTAVDDDPVVTGYTVHAMQGENVLFARFIERPRHYLHEGDYLYAGLDGAGGDGSEEALSFVIFKNESTYGLDYSGYHQTVIAVVTNTVSSTPAFVTGHDTTFAYARNQLVWTMDTNATWYGMEFRADGSDSQVDLSGNPLLQTGHLTSPFRDVEDHYTADFPFYAGDLRSDGTAWTNGRYWVQITTGMELGGTVSSAWMPFNLGVREPDQNAGKSMIEGKLYNFGGHDFFSDALRRDGAVSNQMPVIVQTFSNPGFSGVPDAQVTIAPSVWTNTEYRYEAVFQLKGLHRGSHYLRAFVDSNENGLLDEWETWGFNRDIQTYYEPLRISLESAGVMQVQDQMLIIRDRDTDDDGLPDIWEYDNYERNSGITLASVESFLNLIGGESIGLNELSMGARWQYGLDAFTAVAIVDQNVNGISDVWELYYFLTLLDAGDHLNDDDGDGMSAYAEYINGSDPTNPGESLNLASMMLTSGLPTLTWSGVSNYRVSYTDSLMATWLKDDNIANYSRDDIGGGAYTWTYVDPAPPASSRFYRVVIVPDTDPRP